MLIIIPLWLTACANFHFLIILIENVIGQLLFCSVPAANLLHIRCNFSERGLQSETFNEVWVRISRP